MLCYPRSGSIDKVIGKDQQVESDKCQACLTGNVFFDLSTLYYIMPRRLKSSILSLFLFFTTLTTAQNIQYATRFPKNKLYDLSPSSTGLDTIDGTVAAFGDFNGDK